MEQRKKKIRDILSTGINKKDKAIKYNGSSPVSQINIYPGAQANIVTYTVGAGGNQEITNATVKPEELTTEERARIYRQCHAMAKQYDIYQEMRSEMRTTWGATSMRDLADDELQSLYKFMRSLEEKITLPR